MPVSYLSKRLSPYVRVAAIIVVAALLILAGARVQSWRSYGPRSRLLTLVNPWNPVSETGYTARLVEIEDGFQVDRACAESLQKMLADCRTAGRNVVITDAYRSVDDQLVLHDVRVQSLVDGGLSPEQAEMQVARTIAAPGRSEHELTRRPTKPRQRPQRASGWRQIPGNTGLFSAIRMARRRLQAMTGTRGTIAMWGKM